MQKTLLLFFLLFTVNASTQIDSLETNSLSTKKMFSYSVVIPFSSESLNKLPLVSKNILPQKKDNIKSFLFLFLLNLIAIAVFLLTISRTKVKKLISTIFSINVLMQYAKVETKRDNSYLWAYFILFLIFFSAIVYVFALNFQLELDVLAITLSFFIFITLDFLVNYITGYVFKLEAIKEMCHFNNFSFVLILLPFFIISILLLLFLSMKNTLFLSVIFFIVIVVSYLWKELRNLLILEANRINIFSFYFFLYLCTFKILPIAIFLKITYRHILNF